MKQTESRYFLGVDLGKYQDYTALALVEKRTERLYGMDWVRRAQREEGVEVRYLLRMMRRLQQGTSYERVVEEVKRVADGVEKAGRCEVVVDATGLGAAVVEMLERGVRRVAPVVITGGETARGDGRSSWVPKKDLMSQLAVALEKRELRGAREIRERGLVERELKEMRITRGASGGEKYGSPAGGHDDLVMALALACWRAMRRKEWGEQRKDLGLW
jgi:phage FluMu gp28-like protein